MFPQLKKLNNESGIVLFIVLMTAIIIMIFSVGILTQSMNEINYAQQQIDQIVSQELAKGVFWNNFGTLAGTSPSTSVTSNSIGGRTYNITTTSVGSSGGVTNYQTVVSYDTF